MPSKKRIILLGATGSIGRSALDVVRTYPERFEIAALSAHSDQDALLRLADEFRSAALSLSGAAPRDPRIAYAGPSGLEAMIRDTPADLVLNAVSGAAGLVPSLASVESGKDLALANKESLVMAGTLLLAAARSRGVRVLPVDSEHSAIFHLLNRVRLEDVGQLVLTASGGAFRDLPLERLASVTVDEALAHPTWSMGAKITVDSATMANKGLEIIEAVHLFGIDASRIEVRIHPQSLVHSFVRTVDGVLYAQASLPDMRVPIRNALTFPEILPSRVAYLDLLGTRMDFFAPDPARYPLLSLAGKVAAKLGALPVVFNAANEVAVAAFLSKRIPFTGISQIVAGALDRSWPSELPSLGEILDVDRRARLEAAAILESSF